MLQGHAMLKVNVTCTATVTKQNSEVILGSAKLSETIYACILARIKQTYAQNNTRAN